MFKTTVRKHSLHIRTDSYIHSYTLVQFFFLLPMSKNNETIFQKLRSTIILLIVLAVVSGLLYVMYRIFMAIKEGIQEAMSSHNINISKTAANIGVQSRSQQSIVDSAQRYAYRAWENSQPPEDAKPVSRLFRLREWKDRKRHVYQGTGAQAANSGWFS